MAKRKRKGTSAPSSDSPPGTPQPNSHDTPTPKTQAHPDTTADEQTNDTTAQQVMGDSTADCAVAVLEAPPRTRESRAQATNRWITEGIRHEVEAYRDQIRGECLAAGASRYDANEQAWEAAFSRYPPPGVEPAEALKAQIAPSTPISGDNARVAGLGEIPPHWPPMADNASLPAEIGWVQSNRLAVVEELPSGSTRVHLERARSPAPSWAALGWLETSIRSYAKYVDVVARSLAVVQDEQERVRRERLALEEIDALLREMDEE